MKHTITLIPGDGIGPEVTNAVVKVLETAGLDVEWEPHAAGVLAIEQHGDPLPAALIDSTGKRFMPEYDKRAELAPRDVVSLAIVAQMEKTRSPSVMLVP